MTSIMRSVVRAVDSSRAVLSDFLSVPKIMGIGPIIIAPPPVTFPVLSFFERTRRMVATIMISVPTSASVVPKL